VRSDKFVSGRILMGRTCIAAHGHKKTKGHELAYQVGAAIAHKWKRGSCNRQKVDVHAHINNDMHNEEDSNASPI
jgi:hypothetical protein